MSLHKHDMRRGETCVLKRHTYVLKRVTYVLKRETNRKLERKFELSPHVKRVKSLRSVESRGFPPGTPVSSHRESRQGGLGDTGPQ